MGKKLSEKYDDDTDKWSNVIQAVIQMSNGALKNGVVCVYNNKVPKSRGILIHAGQDGGWTEGCILPSKTLNKDLDKRNMQLKESVETLHEILNRIDKIGIENIKMIIKDETD